MSKVAVVTGGAQGIGRALVERLLAEGWRAAALDRDQEALAELAGEHAEARLLPVECDVADEGAVARAFTEIGDWLDRAGFDKSDVDQVIRLIRINEYKRRQAPPGIRISSRAFGRDWRYPITSGYHFPG